MAVGVDVPMLMAVAVAVGRIHGKVLYYNITGVYKRNQRRLLTGATGGVANARNDNPGRVRSVEDDIGVWICHEAAEVVLAICRIARRV